VGKSFHPVFPESELAKARFKQLILTDANCSQDAVYLRSDRQRRLFTRHARGGSLGPIHCFSLDFIGTGNVYPAGDIR
jgi:hypothetical protein